MWKDIPKPGTRLVRDVEGHPKAGAGLVEQLGLGSRRLGLSSALAPCQPGRCHRCFDLLLPPPNQPDTMSLLPAFADGLFGAIPQIRRAVLLTPSHLSLAPSAVDLSLAQPLVLSHAMPPTVLAKSQPDTFSPLSPTALWIKLSPFGGSW